MDPITCSPGLLSLADPQALATGLCFSEWLTPCPGSRSPRHTPSAATATVPQSLHPEALHLVQSQRGSASPRVCAEGLDNIAWGCWGNMAQWRGLAHSVPCGLFRQVPHSDPWWLVAKLWHHGNVHLPFCSPCLPVSLSISLSLVFLGLHSQRRQWTFTSGSAFWGTATKTGHKAHRKWPCS